VGVAEVVQVEMSFKEGDKIHAEEMFIVHIACTTIYTQLFTCIAKG